MKNKFNIFILLIFFYFINFEVKSEDQFNFDVTEIQVTENGNKFIGKKRGRIISNNGIIINADEFEYDKKSNIINANGNVEVKDTINDYLIYTKKIIYDKNKEIIITEDKSKGIDLKQNIIITAKKFLFYNKLNLLNASGKVEVHDKINNYLIYSEKISYDKNKDIIVSEEKSKAISVKDEINISAKKIKYNKKLNTISGYKNVIIIDNIKKYELNSDYTKYLINEGKIFSRGNSRLVNFEDQTRISSENLDYDIFDNIFIANENVVLQNQEKDYKIFSDKMTYLKTNAKIFTEGNTLAEIHSKYMINSKDVTFYQNQMELSSNYHTIIKDNLNIYNTSRFKYFIEEEFLKGENIVINSNYKNPQNDKFYFTSGMINLKNQNFIAGDTEVNVRKDIFDNLENDPRIKGRSSFKNNEIVTINKGIFTSCKKNDKCPPWAIEASEIKHDRNKQEIFYKNAFLKLYNVPVLYFPKFFHPDPTVNRRSGILKPVLNNSNVLGSSLTIPYYHVISEDSDITITPTKFDTGSNMVQNEYRKIGKNSNYLFNFGHVQNYKSKTQNKEKNTSYIFSKINYNLDLPDFNTSKIDINFEKVTNDVFLKIFDSNFHKNTTSLKPTNNSVMSNSFSLNLINEKFNLSTGVSVYEDLQKGNSDKYQFILPYYDLNTIISPKFINGSVTLNSNGSNNLNNTNQLVSKITNNLSFSSNDFFTKYGFKNNYNINLKNLNSTGKNVSGYKSSLETELSSLFEINSSLPLKKENNYSSNFLTPKASFRFNPSDMKNHKNSDNTINVGNIFSVNRFGFGDSYESGKSITLGIDYRKEIFDEKFKENVDETLDEMNKYFEMKLATVYRDSEESFIPSKTTLDKKTSNLFGSISTNTIDNLEIGYNFAIDNNLNDFEYNDFYTNFTFNNFSTTFNFIKSINEMGNENLISNSTTYKFDDQNFLKFNTRRNRKIDLTEFYDLVYEYKNDCLVAGIKYKKTYYEDKDLKPVEDLLFTLTFVPLTRYEHRVDQF